MFKGNDGNELLGEEFEDLMSPDDAATSFQRDSPGETVQGLQTDAQAARHMLETLGHAARPPSPSILPALQQHQQQQQQQQFSTPMTTQPFGPSTMATYALTSPLNNQMTFFMDPMTGQIMQQPALTTVQLHQINGQLVALQVPMQGQFLGQQLMLQGGPGMHLQAMGGMPDDMQVMPGVLLSPTQLPPTPQKKRKRAARAPGDTSTPLERATRITGTFSTE